VSNPKRKPEVTEKKADGPLVRLMKEMGSKTGEFAPEPRDQYVWQKNNGETALDRLIGYVKLHSVGRHPPCAFMVHENGNPYSSRQIAVGLGWTHGHTQNTITAGKRAGLLRQLGRRGAIGLSGQVPGASEERRNNGDEADKAKSPVQVISLDEADKAKSPVQVISLFLNHGLLAHIKRLSHELQKEAFLYAKAFDTWAAGVQARKAAEGRQIVHEAQYNVFPLFGYKPPPAKPKKTAPKLSFEEELAQVIAPPVPVAFRAPSRQNEITCTGDDSSPIQVTVSLLTSETTREELTKGTPSASADAEGVQPSVISESTVKQSAAAAALTRAPNTSPPPPLIDWMRQGLKAYPGAKGLAGEPDDAICRRCLSAGTPDEVSAALVCMHKAGKAPLKSWAWFTVDIIRQHIPRRKKA